MTSRAPSPPVVACIHHLERAIAIQCERDHRKWPALIDALPDEAREPCRAGLANDMNPPRRKNTGVCK